MGSAITAPQDLFSQNGVLQVNFSYQTAVDPNGNTLYCFVTSDGSESPTLHVNPGDRLVINLMNNVPAGTAMPGMTVSAANACGASMMTSSSVNMHFHGTNTQPVCHQDEAIHTLVNSGETFQYDLQFPSDEPPGLYWYHPHVHGISAGAVRGGATGAIIVEGIQNVNPAAAGLGQQILVIRDGPVTASPVAGQSAPAADISLNYVPVPYPAYTPAKIQIKPGEKQFWRVLNSSSDTIINLQLQYDGTAQPLEVVALDGVPTGSQDGAAQGTSETTTTILLAPSARAEFIVTGPSPSVQNASLVTLGVDTGPAGAPHPARPIAAIVADANAPEPASSVPQVSGPPSNERFSGLGREKPVTERRLYFSEDFSDPNNPKFFLTVDGQTPAVFSASDPPAIVTTQGSVEDWTIENRAMENHEFHIHQIHFLLLEQNGIPITDGQYLDVIQIPYWTGSGPYPSVKVRMDFRGQVAGDFVYHCHILSHEDLGMMAIIRVKPAHGNFKRRP